MTEQSLQIACILDWVKKEDSPPTESQIAEVINQAAAKGIRVTKEAIERMWPLATGWIWRRKYAALN